MARKPSRFRETSRSCRCRRVPPNSTLKKTSGNTCVRTGYRTESSNRSTTLSITAALPGTNSLINHGKLCPSLAAIGSSPVNHCEDWYYKNPPIRGLCKHLQEISANRGLRGGPGRTRTSNQTVMSEDPIHDDREETDT